MGKGRITAEAKDLYTESSAVLHGTLGDTPSWPEDNVLDFCRRVFEVIEKLYE